MKSDAEIVAEALRAVGYDYGHDYDADVPITVRGVGRAITVLADAIDRLAAERKAEQEQESRSDSGGLDASKPSAGETPAPSTNLDERVADAKTRIGMMCSKLQPPKMSIPARPDYDDDFVITRLLDNLLSALKAAEARRGVTLCEKEAIELDQLRAEVGRLRGDYETCHASRVHADGAVLRLEAEVERLKPKPLTEHSLSQLADIFWRAKAEHERMNRDVERGSIHHGIMEGLRAVLQAAGRYEAPSKVSVSRKELDRAYYYNGFGALCEFLRERGCVIEE